ncbi:DUF3000 domain-containing protein [Arsenicicoccus dermatophilus]|uniref:DUF3000 domain-containing protein n=1 Tax=Arsenicicoccus dermatophilus TaxID=1076331 RepID=UPI001F4CDA5B|nr:DUF3000 domain-containing protein [Arsenicicoccus dermatophilus]
MADRRVTDDSSRQFEEALVSVRAVRRRPEIVLEEVPAPGRLAPHSLALAADVMADPRDDDELASGRFVVLFDPAAPDPWGGCWRVVTYARAAMEPEVAADPALGGAGWSWLQDGLERAGVEVTALAGTVTRIVSEKFGDLAEDGAAVEMEIRASWTAVEGDLGAHLSAWCEVLCTLGGLPPLPEGVAPLASRR